jgi:hypothetical protein
MFVFLLIGKSIVDQVGYRAKNREGAMITEDVIVEVARRCIDACDNVVVCRTFAERFKERITIAIDFVHDVVSATDISCELSKKALVIFMQELCSFISEATFNWTKLTHTSSIREILLMGTEPWRKLSDINAKLISKLGDLCSSLKYTSKKDLSPLSKIGHSINLDIRNAKAIIALDDQTNYLASQLGKLSALHNLQYYIGLNILNSFLCHYYTLHELINRCRYGHITIRG